MIPVVVLSLVTGFIYAIWMIFTACKRRWKKLGLQFAGLFCCVALLYSAGAVYRGHELTRYHQALFHVAVKLPDPLFFYDSSRDFHGDGYSIDVYELPKAIHDRFEKFDEKEWKNIQRSLDTATNGECPDGIAPQPR